jgi:hypothetical protein
MSRTTPELDSRHDPTPVEVATSTPTFEPLPAARIAFVRFALAEIEQLPEDGPLAHQA